MPHLICRASGKNELAVRIERQAVDLSSVGIHCMARLGGVVGPRVPTVPKTDKSTSVRKKCETEQQLCFNDIGWGCLHHQFLVICHRSKERFVEKVPGDVLHHSSVACEDSLGIHNLPLFGNCADIPQAYSLQRAQRNVKKKEKNK